MSFNYNRHIFIQKEIQLLNAKAEKLENKNNIYISL